MLASNSDYIQKGRQYINSISAYEDFVQPINRAAKRGVKQSSFSYVVANLLIHQSKQTSDLGILTKIACMIIVSQSLLTIQEQISHNDILCHALSIRRIER